MSIIKQGKRLAGITAAAALVLLGLTACIGLKAWKPERNTIKIEADKPIAQAMFFGKDMGDEEKNRLFDELMSKIDEYTSKYGADKIDVTVPEENKREASDIAALGYVVIEYSGMKELGRFNDYSVYEGEYAQAADFGFDADRSYYAANDKGLDTSQVYKLSDIAQEGYRLLVLDPDMQPNATGEEAGEELNYIELAGYELLYATDNVIIEGKHSCAVKPDAKEEAFVIYKPAK